MTRRADPARPPAEIRIESPEGETVYELDPKRHAVVERRQAPNAALTAEGRSFRIVAGPPGPERAGPVLPVYRLGADGPAAVPSGRVHVRLGSDRPLRSLEEPLGRLGFRIVEVHAYAPFAGWIEPRAGGVGFTLAHWPEVRDLAGVEHAEPQMLRQPERRDPPAGRR